MPEPPPSQGFVRLPMLWLAASFAAGILIQSQTSVNLTVSIALAAAAGLVALINPHPRYSTLFLLIAFAAAGIAAAGLEAMSVSANRIKGIYETGVIAAGEPVELEGILTGPPEPAPGGEFLAVRAQKIIYHGEEWSAAGNVRLFVPPGKAAGADEDGQQPISNLRSEISDGAEPEIPDLSSDISNFKYGSRIRVFCKLSRDDQYLNPGVVRKPEVLDRLGLDATGTVKSPLLITKLSDESVFIPLAWVYDQRARLIEQFRHNLNGPAAGIMIASLLGDKYFLDHDTADLFREGGTFHVLVISGLHITFIGGLLLLLVRLFTRNRWIQFVFAIAVMWAYTLAVGADLPVVRAAIMFTVVSYGYVIYRQGNAVNSLCFCGLLLLAWRPSDVFNPSFQLTFVSVAAIVTLAVPLIDRLRRIGKWTPSTSEPFPPNVPVWLRRFCETLYWNEIGWQLELKRQIWTARLFKSPYLPNRVKDTVQRSIRYLFEGLLVSMIVQIAMLPLMIWYFHRVSMAGVFLNIWVGVLLAVESFAAVGAACLAQVSGFLSQPLFVFADKVNWLMLSVPRLFSDGTWSNFRLPAYAGSGRAFYVVYFVPIAVLAVLLNRWDPFAARSPSVLSRKILYASSAVLAGCLLVIAAHPFIEPRPDGRLHVDFLDVGQGDAALVTFPDGETLLVDGGGRFKYRVEDDESGEPFEPDVLSVGEAVASVFLWNRGYSQIDHILATHADADHIQGLTDVAKNFRVGTAIFGRAPMRNPNFANLADVLARRGVPAVIVEAGDRITFGDVEIEVLYPLATDDPDAVSDNDHSVVLRIVYGSRVFLLTGDIERGAEAEILNSTGTVAADLIKVAHHGSRTSSTQQFIDAVGAKYAVISVGRTSPFGHPHQQVIDRWNAAGAKVMRTGERGTISVSTNGSDLQISTFIAAP